MKTKLKTFRAALAIVLFGIWASGSIPVSRADTGGSASFALGAAGIAEQAASLTSPSYRLQSQTKTADTIASSTSFRVLSRLSVASAVAVDNNISRSGSGGGRVGGGGIAQTETEKSAAPGSVGASPKKEKQGLILKSKLLEEYLEELMGAGEQKSFWDQLKERLPEIARPRAEDAAVFPSAERLDGISVLPVTVKKSEKNTRYQLVVLDTGSNTIGVQSPVFNKNEEGLQSDKSEQAVDLGVIEKVVKTPSIKGYTAPLADINFQFQPEVLQTKAEVAMYFQEIESIVVKTKSDEDGYFEIKIPEDLKFGKHSLKISQEFPNGDIPDNLNCDFKLVADREASDWSAYLLIIILLIVIPGVLFEFAPDHYKRVLLRTWLRWGKSSKKNRKQK